MNYNIVWGQVKNHPEFHQHIEEYFEEIYASGYLANRPQMSTYEHSIIFALQTSDEKEEFVSFVIVAPFPLLEGRKFRMNHFLGNILVMAAYTNPKFRNKGFYNFVFNFMVEHYKKYPNQYKRIISGFNVKNQVAKHIQLKKQNRTVNEMGKEFCRTTVWLNPDFKHKVSDKIDRVMFRLGLSRDYDKDFYKKLFARC